MLKRGITVITFFLTVVSVGQELTRIDIGTKSIPDDSEIVIELVARKQHYNPNPEAPTDNYDRSISSPKSVVFTPDGKKFYVHSLEGYTTSAYNAETFEKIAQHEWKSCYVRAIVRGACLYG